MIFHFPVFYSDLGLLFMRLIVALVFGVSGWNDLKNPAGRAQSMSVSRGFAVFLGAAELLGSIGIALGILLQPAALGLILVSLGAIQKKMFVWKTGFWGKGSDGWHYDLLFLAMNLVILLTGGGGLRIF